MLGMVPSVESRQAVPGKTSMKVVTSSLLCLPRFHAYHRNKPFPKPNSDHIKELKMGKSDKKAKSDKIKIIRQQYDAFMDEDKKRKERNEYIINRLDKMRCCDYVVPYRPKIPNVNENYNTQSFSRYAHIPEPAKEDRISRSQILQSPVDLTLKTIDESMILKEVSKKYILIPKLKIAVDNSAFLPKKTDIESSFEDNDWTSKYDILNQLKQEEKENISAHVEGSKDKNLHIFATQLNEKTIDSHCSPKDYKYETPVRDDTNFETKKDEGHLNEKQICKTDFGHEDLVNSTVEANLAAHRNSTELNKDDCRAEIVELTPERPESITNETDYLQDLANAVIAQERQRLNDAAEAEKNITLPKNNTGSHDASNEEAKELHRSEKEKKNETHPIDYNITNYEEQDGNVEYEKAEYQYVADPNLSPEQTTSTDVVHHEEQHQVHTQGYEKQLPIEYNDNPDGENTAYIDESYAHEQHNQQYYDPKVAQGQYQEQEYQVHEHQEQEYHGQEHQEQEYHGQEHPTQLYHGQEYQGPEYQGQEYQGQEYQGQEYQGQVYQGQEYQDQYVTEAHDNSYHPQYEQNVTMNDNTIVPQPEPIDESLKQTSYPETLTVQNNVPAGVVLQNEYVINPTLNPDYVEGIQEFELEANLYNNVDPNISVGPIIASEIIPDENILQQPVSQEDYNVCYEDNQVAQDPLDMDDHDATLQQYDQSYEDQYTGNYEEEVPIVENVPVAYEPVQSQKLEYEEESVMHIEKTLDNEQGYVMEGDIQDPDVVPNIIQQVNEQHIDQNAKLQQDVAAVKKEMLKKN